MKVAVLGGSGKLGLGLAWRARRAGHQVTIGSRDPAKARAAARSVDPGVQGLSNVDAAEACEIAFLSVPYAGHHILVESVRLQLQHKILVDATVPFDPATPLRIRTGSGKSAAEEAQALLGEETAVFAAFQTISYRVLRQAGATSDVLVAGNPGRKKEVLDLIAGMDLRPVDAGSLEASRLLEQMTLLLISINRQYQVNESGIKILGIR